MAKVISAQTGVPPNAIVITNTRTNAGFGNYVVGDCRRKDCRLRRKLLQSEVRLRVEFDVTILADDTTAGNVGHLLESIQSPNATDTRGLFVQQLGSKLSNGTSGGGLSVGLTRPPSAGDLPSDSVKSVSIDVAGEAFVCSPGQYIVVNASQGGASKCGVCPAGSTGDGTDAMCFLCPPHHYAAKPGSAKCKSCAIGFFQEKRGGESCFPCPESPSGPMPVQCVYTTTTTSTTTDAATTSVTASSTLDSDSMTSKTTNMPKTGKGASASADNTYADSTTTRSSTNVTTLKSGDTTHTNSPNTTPDVVSSTTRSKKTYTTDASASSDTLSASTAPIADAAAASSLAPPTVIAIAGSTTGGLVVLAVVIVILVCFVKRRSAKVSSTTGNRSLSTHKSYRSDPVVFLGGL